MGVAVTAGVKATRSRLVLFAVVTLVALAGAGGYVVNACGRSNAAGPVLLREDLGTVVSGPHIVFRNEAPGQGYGRVAVVPLSDPDGARALTPVSCHRVYADASQAVCLSALHGLDAVYQAQLLGPDWTPVEDLPLAGIPSRARLSPDGSLVATTTFIFGDSYTQPGQFSTQTLITETADDSNSANIEAFLLMIDGRRVTAADRNLWGVTFADRDRFYATAATGGRTWLVEGSRGARTLTALRENAECPSLSPDGTRVAYKKRVGDSANQWRLAVYNLRTGTETLLSETRSIDDQVEWLDNSHLLYGLPRGGISTDIWVIPADGTGTARLLIPNGWSPAVVRASRPADLYS